MQDNRMNQNTSDNLKSQGYCVLPDTLSSSLVDQLIHQCEVAFQVDQKKTRTSSSRGHIYAARNLIDASDLFRTFWKVGFLRPFLLEHLGDSAGLVRVLFFDKPPDRTWALPWHKDTAIAVKSHGVDSQHFSRPTVKAGIPHLIASDDILRSMLTLRVHLDEVTDENGPLRVIPKSHRSSECEGDGTSQACDILAQRGEILAMRPLITHGSGPSKEGTKRHRRILHLEFSAVENLPDGYQWHDFVSISS